MSASAPAPAVIATDGTLWLAYRIARDPHHCAIVRFHQLVEYAWGAPPAVHGDDVPGDLPRGRFYRVRTHHWIITFPDGLLNVHAASGEVVLRAIAAVEPSHALAALLA